jgi:hypothetical protein
MIKSTLNRGFMLTFLNGLTISVQFGSGNYCENRSLTLPYEHELKQHITKSNSAEIAIWGDVSDKWLKFKSDEVKGWVHADDIAKYIHYVQKAKDLKHCRVLLRNHKML